jgi:hypothetical protein
MSSTASRRRRSRRSFLRIGTLGVGGLSLGEAIRLRAEAGEPSLTPDTSVIFLWLAGDPPHMETYDMKPDAPSDYRGQFSPIRTNVPGIEVCEHLPLHAKCADKYTLIRSIAHTFSDHGGGSKRFMTGRIPNTPTGTLNDAPSVTSIVAKMRGHLDVGLPNCVAGTNGSRSKVDTYAMGSAYLGPSYRPLTSNDLWATVYKHLGIDQNATIPDHTGRPQFILPFGNPIAELL